MNWFKLRYVVFVLALLPALRASDNGNPLVGNWEGSARVIVQWCEQSQLLVSLEITPDGKATGKVGDAVLVGGRLRKKNTWFGGKSEKGTTHILKASLKGEIVGADGISRDKIFIHLRYESDGLSGSLATSGAKVGGKETMALTATPLRLARVD